MTELVNVTALPPQTTEALGISMASNAVKKSRADLDELVRASAWGQDEANVLQRVAVNLDVSAKSAPMRDALTGTKLWENFHGAAAQIAEASQVATQRPAGLGGWRSAVAAVGRLL